MVFVSLLDGGESVGPGLGHPLLVFLVVLELLREGRVVLTGGRGGVSQRRSVFKAQPGSSDTLPLASLVARVLEPTALHGQVKQVLRHGLVCQTLQGKSKLRLSSQLTGALQVPHEVASELLVVDGDESVRGALQSRPPRPAHPVCVSVDISGRSDSYGVTGTRRTNNKHTSLRQS